MARRSSIPRRPGAIAHIRRQKVAARVWFALAAGGVLSLAVAVWSSVARPGAERALPVGPPSAWRLAAGELTVLDDAGQTVFSHDFGVAISTPVSSFDAPTRRWPVARIADIDGEGRPEVLVSPPAVRREDRRFHCFEADGRLGSSTSRGPSLRRHGVRRAVAAHAQFVTGPKQARSLFVYPRTTCSS
jgi:hypothetical protein